MPKEDPCTCNVGTCKVHVKFVLKSTAKKGAAEPPKSDEPLKRKASVKKKSDNSNSPSSKLKKSDSDLGRAEKSSRAPSVARSRESSVKPEDEKKEVIKIINFVAIKVTVNENEMEVKTKRSCKKLEKGSDKSESPFKQVGIFQPPAFAAQDTSPPTSSPSVSPPPVVSPSPPAKPATPSPPPPPSPPPVVQPPPSPPSLQPDPPLPSPRSLSPVYTRKFFPNPVTSEPYKPKVFDYCPAPVRLKRVDDYEEPEARPVRRPSRDVEVRPLKFSAVEENCIKQALFLGDQYMGAGNMVDIGTRHNCDIKAEEAGGKRKPQSASSKIIDILTAKKLRDEATGPGGRHCKLSDYVTEKLRQASRSRSGTPASKLY